MSAKSLWAVYVYSYDPHEAESYLKFAAGPFTKARAEKEADKLRREKVVADFKVKRYQGPRIALDYSRR